MKKTWVPGTRPGTGFVRLANWGAADRRQTEASRTWVPGTSPGTGFARVANWRGAEPRQAEAPQAKRWNGRIRQRASGLLGNLLRPSPFLPVPAFGPATPGER